ncbi:MAG: LCP family protein [Candidatus Saganbacteria bacterium]|nr:LCP family protein [Candidatus Saganbacteria bacterium]
MRKKQQIDLLRIIALLLIFLMMIYAWLFIFMPRSIPHALMLFVPGSKLNIILIGKDHSYDEFHNMVKNSRSDTLILAQINPFINKITLVSIPRDSFVDIPGYGSRKINEAYLNGKEDLVKTTVKQLIGIDIHGYMTVDTKGFVSVVDSLGGLVFYVEKNMRYDDNWGGLHIDLKKGKQRLSGKQLEGYVRFRHDSEGDIARVRRQQASLKQIFKKLSSPAALVRLPWIIPSVKASIETDISFTGLLRIANFARSIEPSDIRIFTLPGHIKDGDPHWYIDPEMTRGLFLENKIL